MNAASTELVLTQSDNLTNVERREVLLHIKDLERKIEDLTSTEQTVEDMRQTLRDTATELMTKHAKTSRARAIRNKAIRVLRTLVNEM